MTHYNTLGLEKDCDHSDVRRQYKKLAARYHPDQPNGDTKKFQEIQEAYECLSDENKRAHYDMSLNIHDNGFMHGIFRNIFDVREMHNASDEGNDPNEDIHLEFKTTLMDVYNTPEQSTGFNRFVLVDDIGNVVKDPSAATSICKRCHGIGAVQEIVNMGFFSQQTVQNCPRCIGKGYTTNPGYKLVNKKQKFRRILPYGVEDDNVLKMEGEGNLVYSKSKRKFRYSDLYITTRYDIAETNKLLERKHGISDIKISNVHSGNIDYIYSANIFEFITGTQFNLPLPNGRLLLIKISDLSAVKNILGFGLPVSKTSYGNINIIFELKVLNPSGLLAISDVDKLTLKRIAISAYPKTQSSDAVVVDFH